MSWLSLALWMTKKKKKKKKSMQDKTVLCMEGLQGEPVYIDQGVNPGLTC